MLQHSQPQSRSIAPRRSIPVHWVMAPPVEISTARGTVPGGITIKAEYATDKHPGAFPQVTLFRETCAAGSGERCAATCPSGRTAISGGLDRATRASGPAYPVSADAWAADLSGEIGAGPVTVWVMCL